MELTEEPARKEDKKIKNFRVFSGYKTDVFIKVKKIHKKA
jgi:hypothetical protein